MPIDPKRLERKGVLLELSRREGGNCRRGGHHKGLTCMLELAERNCCTLASGDAYRINVGRALVAGHLQSQDIEIIGAPKRI